MVCEGPKLRPAKQINSGSLGAPKVLLLLTDYSLSLRFDLWVERRVVDFLHLIPVPLLLLLLFLLTQKCLSFY